MEAAVAPLLSVRGLVKVYDDGRRALDGVDLDVAEGELVAVIGLSGAGKSTLLRCLDRLVEPTEGSIRLAGREVTTLAGAALRAHRASAAMVFQGVELIGRASVLANVLTGGLHRTPTWRTVLGLWPRAAREEARAHLASVGLADRARQRADTLSGGQQQRVGIARALMQRPRLLLADEPVASLDPSTSHEVLRVLARLREEHGLTVLLNVHVLSLARTYGTRIVALRDGRVVYDGPPGELTDARFEAIYGAPPTAGEMA